MMPLFEETQRLPRFLIAALLSGVVVFGAVIAILAVTGTIELPVTKQLALLWVLMALLDSAMASVKMATEVSADGLLIFCKPLRFLRRHVDWSQIERIYPRAYSPLAEYGGWGIRRGKSGTAYTMRGSQGIQLELKNGRKLLIGTQEPEAFMAAVRSTAPAICA